MGVCPIHQLIKDLVADETLSKPVYTISNGLQSVVREYLDTVNHIQ